MDILHEIVSRRSVRKFKAQPVEEEKVCCLIESARLAPSGSNTQPWRFILVRSEEIRKKLVWANHNQTWMMSAPLLLVCVADLTCRVADTAGIVLDENSPELELKQIIRDTSIAIGYLLLEAEHLGLSACWTAWFEQREVRRVLQMPNDKYACGIVCIGYGMEAPAPRPRRLAKELIYYETWDQRSDLELMELKTEQEQTEALDLVWSVFQDFEAPEYGTEGITAFWNAIHDQKYRSSLRYYGAVEHGKLAGMLATRNNGCHIALFFVRGDRHHRGIGRRLFERACQENTTSKMTVNSSPYAVMVYHRLGFVDLEGEQVSDGIRFTPMVCKIK